MENQNQKQNQVQKKSVGSNALIIVLILIILATSAFGIFAWARYQTSVEGEGTAQVAKWKFTVNGNETQTEQVSFLMTRTDNNQTVVEGTIAPGTYGEIPIEIDVTGTQTDLIYTISGTTVNMPRNLKLYADSARTQLIQVSKMNFTKVNYLKLSDIGTEEKIITETIYWEWPFETGTTEDAKQMNNQKDTEDMGKTMTMALTVEGKQTNGNFATLANVVQVGDYVNYDASSNGVQTFSSSDCLAGSSISATISTAESFNSEAKAQWRVLSVDKAQGTIELMAVDPTVQTVTLSGGDGFVNAETVLNNVGAIYGQGKGAIRGRSITVEDVDQYSSYDKTTFSNSTNTVYYGNTKDYKFGNYYKEIKDEEGNIIGYETTTTKATNISPVTMTETEYTYTAQNYFSNSTIYNMIFKNSTDNSIDKSSFFLASRCVGVADECYFLVRCASKGVVNCAGLYTSVGKTYTPSYSVVPVVSLTSNIQTIGQDKNGVWQLKID